MKREKILIVEDDGPILTGLTDLLSGEGYAVCAALDGPQALAAYEREKPTLILLDIMIPELSGYEVCRRIRQRDPFIPILMLTAKGQEADKLVGFELGADDYIVKPFSLNELLARVRAAYRRLRARLDQEEGEPLHFGQVRIDPRSMKGTRGEKVFPLSRRELRLLRLFLRREGEALDRGALLDEVWGIRYEGTTRTLDQHIAKLRRKIEEDPAHPRHLLTVHGVGYRFQGRP